MKNEDVNGYGRKIWKAKTNAKIGREMLDTGKGTVYTINIHSGAAVPVVVGRKQPSTVATYGIVCRLCNFLFDEAPQSE